MAYERKKDITCAICGYQCGGTYIINHIKQKHNLSKEEYLKIYPEAKLYTKDYYKIMQAKGTNELNRRWKDKQYRDRMTKILIDNANNEVYKKRRIEALKNNGKPHPMSFEKNRAKLSQTQKLKWQDPICREKHMQGIKNSTKLKKSKLTREKISKAISEHWEKGTYSNLYKTLDKIYSFGKRCIYINRQNKEFHLASLQELRVAYLLDLYNLDYIYGAGEITTFKYIDKQGKSHRYVPDFQYKNNLIEVKPNGWQQQSQVYNKLALVQIQNNIDLSIYDDELLEDFMPKISRNEFYSKCKPLFNKDDKIFYTDIFNKIGDVRSGYII